MNYLRTSLRNLLRNYKRTTLTMSVLVLGIVGLLTYAGYIDFTIWGYREQTISGGLGHMRIYKNGYHDRGNRSYMNYLIENERQVYRTLLQTPHVQEVTSQLDVRGLLSNGETSEMTEGRGYDLTSVSTISGSYEIEEGEFFAGDTAYQIALGRGLAKLLDAKIGSYLTFMTTTRDGALNAIDVEVTSILNTGIEEYDNMLSIISIDTAKLLLDVEAAEKYIVMLDNTDAVSTVQKSIEKRAAADNLNIEVRSWVDLANFYHAVKKMYEDYFIITQLIILVIVAFSIVNTMRMVIYERMREIGTVRAIGMTRTKVVLMFLYEGIWLGIFSLIIGFVSAYILAAAINGSGGIYISPPPGQSEGYHTMIRPEAIRYLEVTGIVMISVILGALLPAFRASRVKIDEALRSI